MNYHFPSLSTDLLSSKQDAIRLTTFSTRIPRPGCLRLTPAFLRPLLLYIPHPCRLLLIDSHVHSGLRHRSWDLGRDETCRQQRQSRKSSNTRQAFRGSVVAGGEERRRSEGPVTGMWDAIGHVSWTVPHYNSTSNITTSARRFSFRDHIQIFHRRLSEFDMTH